MHWSYYTFCTLSSCQNAIWTSAENSKWHNRKWAEYLWIPAKVARHSLDTVGASHRLPDSFKLQRYYHRQKNLCEPMHNLLDTQSLRWDFTLDTSSYQISSHWSKYRLQNTFKLLERRKCHNRERAKLRGHSMETLGAT